jgi:uncharacterized protein (DUF2384 family)
MESLHGLTAATAEQWAAELEHPDANSIWNRAREVFGDEVIARSWMITPRELFGGRTPEELVNSGAAAQQRRVLEVLIRIDYGVFS